MKYIIILMLLCSTVAHANDVVPNNGAAHNCHFGTDETKRADVFLKCVQAAFGKNGMDQHTATNDASEVVDSCEQGAYYSSLVQVCDETSH